MILNLDNPARPTFVNDSNYPDPEPLLGFSPPEGNAHQAEWSHDNEFVIGTDEDFPHADPVPDHHRTQCRPLRCWAVRLDSPDQRGTAVHGQHGVGRLRL